MKQEFETDSIDVRCSPRDYIHSTARVIRPFQIPQRRGILKSKVLEGEYESGEPVPGSR